MLILFIYFFIYLFILYLYLLATQQNSKMNTKEDNKLIQIKKRGKREKIYTYNKTLVTALRMAMANQVPRSNHAIFGS